MQVRFSGDKAVLAPEKAERRSKRVLLRAHGLLPIVSPPIEDGAIVVEGGRITRVGRFRDLAARHRGRIMDLAETLVMPGFVNAHCHLDYTDMAGQLPPSSSFVDWLKQITETKAGWEHSDYALSWLHGARMLLNSGTTTVGDIEAVPDLLPDVCQSTPLRVYSFLEMIGIGARRSAEEVLRDTVGHVNRLRKNGCSVGLSPHAPYSTTTALLRLTARLAKQRRLRLQVHVGESAVEYQMFYQANGEMFGWLQRARRDMSDCGGVTPIQHLARTGLLGQNTVAVHANYLGTQDASLLANHQTSVAHCPRSHSYFRHRRFPLRRLKEAGVNVCLATDSLASVYQPRRQTVELNMFEEMRAMAATNSSISHRELITMATVNGAKALGLAGRAGELSMNAWADLILLPWSGKLRDIHDAVVDFRGVPSGIMVGGAWGMAPDPNISRC